MGSTSGTTPGGRKVFTAEIQRRRRQVGDGAESSTADRLASGPVTVDQTEVLSELRAFRHEMTMLGETLRDHLGIAEEEDDTGEPETDPVLAEYERQRQEVNLLKMELRALANSIQETKREIAALRTTRDDSDRLEVVAGELDAIVGSTEAATEGILDAAEKIDHVADNLRANSNDAYMKQLAEEIVENIMVIFEHCNFQDLTGQRITKVVNTLKFVEERVDKMIEIWGHEAFEDILKDSEHAAAAIDDSRLLNGPQLGDKAISQDEIDRLFD